MEMKNFSWKCSLFILTVSTVFNTNASYSKSKYLSDDSHVSTEKSKTSVNGLTKTFLETSEANRHYNEMAERTTCHQPRPVVVNIQEFYQNSSVEYLPHCSILHRCDHESGCCKHNRVCRAKSKSFVDLMFYAVPVDKSKSGSEVVRLTFTNHTSCACEEKVDEDVEVPPTTLPPWLFGTEDVDDYEEENSCKRCPRPFAIRILNEKVCSCDCFHGDDDCLSIKKGLKPMAPEFSSCVRRGDCESPTCYTGEFDVIRGKCSRVCRAGSHFETSKDRCVKTRHRRKHPKLQMDV